jgi:hypothetical protein
MSQILLELYSGYYWAQRVKSQLYLKEEDVYDSFKVQILGSESPEHQERTKDEFIPLPLLTTNLDLLRYFLSLSKLLFASKVTATFS